MIRKPVLVAVFSVLVASACGGDDKINISDACNQDDGVFQELVDKLFECNPAFAEFVFPVTPTRADIETSCEGLFQPFADDRTLRFGDEDDLKACLNAIQNTDCEAFDFDLVPECSALIDGRLAEGDECEASIQCAGDSSCDTPADGSCGVCVARKPDAASCTDDDECAGRECANGTCVTPGEVGDDCEDKDEECLGTLVCNRRLGECQRAQSWAVGDPCESDSDDCTPFVNGLYCSGDEECTEFIDLGDTCTGVAGLCNFFAKQYCDEDDTNTCVDAIKVGDGEACNLLEGRICQDGLVCDGLATGTCSRPAREGDDCDSDAEVSCLGTLFLECVNDVCQLGDAAPECTLEE